MSTSRPRPDLFPPGNGGKYIEFVIPGEGTALVVIYPDARPPIAAKLVSWTPVKVASPPATAAPGAPTDKKDDKPDNKTKKEKEKEKEKTTAQQLAEQSGLKGVADEVVGKKKPESAGSGTFKGDDHKVHTFDLVRLDGKVYMVPPNSEGKDAEWVKANQWRHFGSTSEAYTWAKKTTADNTKPVATEDPTKPTPAPAQTASDKPPQDDYGPWTRDLAWKGETYRALVYKNGKVVGVAYKTVQDGEYRYEFYDKNGQKTTYAALFGTWNDTAAQAGPGTPPITGLADAAAEIAAKKKAEVAAREAAKKEAAAAAEARQRAAALAAAQATGGQSSGGQNSGGSGGPLQTKPNRVTVRGGQAPDKVSGEVYTVTTNRDTGVKTYVMLDGRVYSQGPGGNAYLAGRDDSNERILAYQQDQVEKSVAALNSRGGSVGDWGAAATIAKDGSVNTPSHKPGTVLTPTSSKPSPEAVRPSWASGATADQIATSIESHTEKKESDYPILSDDDYASDNQRDPIEILDKDDPSKEKPATLEAASIFGGEDKKSRELPVTPTISAGVAEAAGLTSTSITDFSSPTDGPFPKVQPAQTSISKATAEAAKLPDTNLVDKHYAITDLSSPRDIYAPNPDKPSELIPLDGLNADPNHNMGRGPMAW